MKIVSDTAPEFEVLLIGGRSGSGKTSVGYEVSDQLQAAGVSHCLIDGDNLSGAYPKAVDDPHGTRLTEANLAALWRNYVAIGHRRLVYVNTVSVLEHEMIVRSMGGSARVTSVLLTASDDTVRERLTRREIGGALQLHLERSSAMATHLDSEVLVGVVRVATDGRSVNEIAADVVEATNWT